MSTAQSLDSLRAEAEASPDDAAGWQRLGLAYFSGNMFAEAAEAYERATQVAPADAILWSALGEALVMASEDEPLPAPARAAFRRAVEIDPGDARARYFLAVEKDLADDHEGALADWLALLADTPAGAPWENDLVRTIQQVGQRERIDVQDRLDRALATRNLLPQSVTGGIPGPSQQQMAAAAQLSPDQQQDMAEGMVARLAERLESDPGNVEGWIMLIRSYRQLGRDGAARDAYQRALSANPGARSQLEAAAQALDL